MRFHRTFAVYFVLMSVLQLHPLVAATCTGDKYCRACSSCRYCGHCRLGGGRCGVCSAAMRNALDSEEVSTIQQYLAALNLYTGPIDGSFGPMSRAAVIQFQKSQKLTPDGVPGPVTRARLEAVAYEAVSNNQISGGEGSHRIDDSDGSRRINDSETSLSRGNDSSSVEASISGLEERCREPFQQATAMLERNVDVLNGNGVAYRLLGSNGRYWGRADCGEGWVEVESAFYLTVSRVSEVNERAAAASSTVTVRIERLQCAREGDSQTRFTCELAPITTEPAIPPTLPPSTREQSRPE